jgi:hypothetical protein
MRKALAWLANSTVGKVQPITRRKDRQLHDHDPASSGTYGYKFFVNGSEWFIDLQTTLRPTPSGSRRFFSAVARRIQSRIRR